LKTDSQVLTNINIKERANESQHAEISA